jgi:glycosyltransferase involved in cell wall biosynthesis
MRVCHLVGSFRPVIGGEERATETLCRALSAEGVDVMVMTRRLAKELPPREDFGGVPVYRLGLSGRGKVHALSFALHSLALLAWRFREYGIIHVQNTDSPLLVGMLARVLLRRRLAVTVHGETPVVAAGAGRLRRARLWAMARVAHAFTAMNPQVRRALRAAGVPAGHIHEVPNGIDDSIFHPPTIDERRSARRSLGLPEADHVVALYLGRLEPWKRVDLLIDAWSELSQRDQASLLVVGPGSQDGALREQAERLGLGVQFHGPTDAADQFYRAADVFVLPSGDDTIKWYEGLSVALIEAMSVGLVPIVTRGPGNEVLVEDGVTGLTFDVGDRDGLIERLDAAIRSRELRERLGRTAHTRALQDYSASGVALRTIDLYRSLLP